ncbi:YraN family protein [Vibrio cholerae]
MVFVNSRQQGNHYEQMAADYLRRQGLSLVTQNVNYRFGELDLIMRDGNTLVFVEVRYRNNTQHGHAAETITITKRARLIKAANCWMLANKINSHSADFRFDVIAIHQQGQHIDWLKNAITEG